MFGARRALKNGIYMKKLALMLALGLSTLTGNAQDVITNYQDFIMGPGININVTEQKHEPVTAPIHLAAGGYSKYPKIVGWNDYCVQKSVHVSDGQLSAQGYEYIAPTLPPRYAPWWYSFHGSVWEQLLLWAFVLALLALLAWAVIALIRYARRPMPIAPVGAPAAPVVNNHYYAAQVPTQMGPNIPSYDAGEINSVISTLKSGLRSGSVYYAHGNGERLHIKVHGPWDGSTDVQTAQPAKPAQPNPPATDGANKS